MTTNTFKITSAAAASPPAGRTRRLTAPRRSASWVDSLAWNQFYTIHLSACASLTIDGGGNQASLYP